MDTVIIPKSEYRKLQKEQKYLRSEVSELRQIIQKVASEELAPTVIKRLLGRSQRIDRGGGIWFRSSVDVKKHLRSM